MQEGIPTSDKCPNECAMRLHKQIRNLLSEDEGSKCSQHHYLNLGSMCFMRSYHHNYHRRLLNNFISTKQYTTPSASSRWFNNCCSLCSWFQCVIFFLLVSIPDPLLITEPSDDYCFNLRSIRIILYLREKVAPFFKTTLNLATRPSFLCVPTFVLTEFR